MKRAARASMPRSAIIAARKPAPMRRGKPMPKDKARPADKRESSDLRGALTHRTTLDPYRKPKAARGQKSDHGLTFTTSKKPMEEMDDVSRRILQTGGDNETGAGTSIFDPVLCELAYRWFCPPGGTVL